MRHTFAAAIVCVLPGALALSGSLRAPQGLAIGKATDTKSSKPTVPGTIEVSLHATQRAIPNRLVFNDKVLQGSTMDQQQDQQSEGSLVSWVNELAKKMFSWGQQPVVESNMVGSIKIPIVGSMAKNVKHLVSLFPDIHEVEFLDNQGCSAAIEAAHSKELAWYFNNEQIGMYKSDICRLAQLAIHGGYYMDNDLDLFQDIRELLPPVVSFASAITLSSKYQMFQAFLAAAPRHPIILLALEKCLDFYKGRSGHMSAMHGKMRGTVLMRMAYEEYMHQDMNYGLQLRNQSLQDIGKPQQDESATFKAAYFFGEDSSYAASYASSTAELTETSEYNFRTAHDNMNCNVILVDKVKRKVLGYSHAIGSQNCQ